MRNDQIINFFLKLVAIDSPSGEEKNVSQFIFQYLKNLNLHPKKDKNDQIYCSINNNPSKKPILFCAHLDTVEPGRNIKPVIRGGYITSGGKTILGADNKVAVASILYAISELISEKINVELVFSVREETDGGIKQFNYHQLRSKVGFVFDLTDESMEGVILKAPYIDDFVFQFYGKLSHASRPEQGINVLSHFLACFSQLSLGRVDKETTFNIGIISGGRATNSVPDYLEVKGDLRSLNKKKFFTLKKRIEEKINFYSNKTKVKADVRWLPYCCGYHIKVNDSYYLRLKKIYDEKFNLKLKPIVSSGGSDASFLNTIGIKTFCLGDGAINSHSLEERVKISNLIRLKEIVKALIRYF